MQMMTALAWILLFVGLQIEWMVIKIDFCHRIEPHFRPKTFGLFLHPLDEFYGFRAKVAWIVFQV